MTSTDSIIDNDFDSFAWNNSTPEQALLMCQRAQQQAGLPHSSEVGGYHLVTRYDDVKVAHADPATFSSAPTVFRPMAPGVPPFPALEFDPPHHGPWREIFRELVNPRTVKGLEQQILADVDRHLDLVIETGTVDLVHDLAEFVPVETICRAAGIADMDLAKEIRLVAQAALDAGGRDPEAFALRLADFGAVVLPLLDERRDHPRDDFLTRLSQAQPQGRPLGGPELTGVLFGLLAAGYHSTTSSMGMLFVHVLTRPEVRRAIAEDPQVIPRVVEESLRLDPPFYGFFRRVTTPTVFSGTQLAEGDSVCLSWVGANHDPAEFDQPAEFRLDRPHYRHLAFGHGIHLCVGAPLARLELTTALQRVLERMPDLELVGEPEPKTFGGGSVTNLASLPARFTPGVRVGRESSDNASS